MGGDEALRDADWGDGTTVSVSRLPGPDHPMARAIGIGELAGRIEVGRPIQLRLDAGAGGRILAATTIVRIDAIGPDIVRISTRNHRYELRRIAGSVAGRAATDAPMAGAGASGRASDSRADGNDGGGHGERTQIVAVADWPAPAPGRFETGARVRLTQERSGGTRALGVAILLVDLVPGSPASFAVEGRVVSTSPVVSVAGRGEGRVQVSTGNSVYLLELVPVAEDADHD